MRKRPKRSSACREALATAGHVYLDARAEPEAEAKRAYDEALSEATRARDEGLAAAEALR